MRRIPRFHQHLWVLRNLGRKLLLYPDFVKKLGKSFFFFQNPFIFHWYQPQSWNKSDAFLFISSDQSISFFSFFQELGFFVSINKSKDSLIILLPAKKKQDSCEGQKNVFLFSTMERDESGICLNVVRDGMTSLGIILGPCKRMAQEEFHCPLY